MAEPEQDTPEPTPEAKTITTLANATALRSLLADPRWEQFIEPILQQLQSRAAKRADSVATTFDGAIETMYLKGVRAGLQQFQRHLTQLRRLAERVIEEARITRPV